VDENFDVKICDFGLSRILTSQNMSTLGKFRGTMFYCAPELTKGDPYTTKSDIYSISICFWEMLHRCINGFYQQPYKEYSHIQTSIQVVMQTPLGLRPTIPKNCPSSIHSLLTSCWDADPAHRPSCDLIILNLKEIEKEYEASSLSWPEKPEYLHQEKEDSVEEHNKEVQHPPLV
jgi:serine/threonine protein kinase